MATNSIEMQTTECPVCHENYNNPKILPCAHLLCRDCLVSWMKKKTDALCPLCRSSILDPQDSGTENTDNIVDSLPTDHTMTALIESVNILSQKQTCFLHRSVVASSLCLQCSVKLCQNCVEGHKSLPVTSFHKLEDLSTLTLEGLTTTRHEPCSDHPDKTLELFCTLHNVLICHVCATSKHRTCPEVIDQQEMYKTYKQTLSEIEDKINVSISAFTQIMTKIQEHQVKSEKATKTALEQIDMTCNSLLKSVEVCRKRLKTLVQEADDKIKAIAIEQKSSLGDRRGRLTAHLNLIQRVLQVASCNSLVTMVPKLKDRITKLDLDATLPEDARQGFKMMTLTIDREALVRVERELRNIGDIEVNSDSVQDKRIPLTTVQTGFATHLRNKRRFDGGTKESDEMVDHQASLNATGHTDPNSVRSQVKQKDLATKSGIRVSVYKADITHLTVDAIVNAANEDLHHGGGVAAHIALAGGPELELEGDKYVKANGQLKVTQVIATKAGNLPCQKVLHAVGPRWDDYIDKEECQHDLEKTVFNSLEKAHILKFSSLALSSISSTIFAVPKAMCARMYLAAVQRFEQQLGTNTTLKHIHFVDISDEMVGIIQDIFTDHWNTTVLPPNILPSVTNNKIPELGTGLALPHLPVNDREQRTVNKSDIYKPKESKEFKTDSGIEVFVYMENIMQLPVDAIVSPIDGQLLHVLGATFSDQTQKGDLRNIGETSFSVTDVIVTPAWNLPCKKVLHAVGPSHCDSQTNEKFQNDLKQTVLNCLTETHKQNVKSVALGCIGSAILDVPKDVCACAYLRAIQEFEKEHGGKTNLQQIHFVDTSKTVVGIIQDLFTSYWSKTFMTTTVLQPQSESRTSEVRNRSLIKAPPTPGNNVTEAQHEIDTSDISVPENCKTFTASFGIRVFVYKADITKLTVNTIVSPTDDHFTLAVGISHAVASAAGPTLSMQKKEYFEKHGSLNLTDVVMTTAGRLPCKNVLHAVGPRQYSHSTELQFKDLLVKTVFNCLQKIQNHNIQSIAFSSISSAVSGAPKDLCAQMYLAAVKKFVKEHGSRTSIRFIHFVDVDDAMVGIIQETFQRYWNTPVTQDDSQQSANDVKQNQRSSSGTQPSCTDTKLNADSFPLFLDKSTESNKKRELFFVVQFPNLNLVIKKKDVNGIRSGAVVFWQTDMKALKEEPVKNYLTKIGEKYPHAVIQGIKQRHEGNLKIAVTKIGKDITLIFSVHPSNITSENINERISEILNKVGIGNVSLSIPLPCFTKAAGENIKEMESYAFGIYTAVENYSRNPNMSLTEVNIIDTNEENIKMMGEIISTKIANDMSQAAPQTQKSSLCAASRRSIVVTNNKQCMFCYGEINNLNFFPCGHGFCTQCIDKSFQQKSDCLICDNMHLTKGTMRMCITSLPLQGFERYGSFEVAYDIPSGTLMDKHGQHKTYSSLSQKAYLPDTDIGRKVLMLLKVAWDRGLTFTLIETETRPRVVWNGIEHKTQRQGGMYYYGYPDPDYLTRVQLALAERGVTEMSLSTCQRNFILHPEQFLYTPNATIDFSYLISGKP